MPLQRERTHPAHSDGCGAARRLAESASATIAQFCRIPRGHEALITTDFSLEDVHFRREWHPPESVGHRCLARGLSDIAAMGGVPHAAFLSLALPADLPQKWVDGFVAGLLKLADRFAVRLAGGDTAQSPDGVLADIVVLGSVPAGTAVLRTALAPATRSMSPASSARRLRLCTGCATARSCGRRRIPGTSIPSRDSPSANICGRRSWLSAMIDISDGLSTDLGHICEESKTGAVVHADCCQRCPATHGLTFALHGGDDYELLFTAPPQSPHPEDRSLAFRSRASARSLAASR